MSTSVLEKFVGGISLLHGIGCVALQPFLFYVTPYEVTRLLGFGVFMALSIGFVVAGAFGMRGNPRAFLVLTLMFILASVQYISPTFGYSFMGPLFIKVGSGPTGPQPWLNVNLVAVVLCALAFKSYRRLTFSSIGLAAQAAEVSH